MAHCEITGNTLLKRNCSLAMRYESLAMTTKPKDDPNATIMVARPKLLTKDMKERFPLAAFFDPKGMNKKKASVDTVPKTITMLSRLFKGRIVALICLTNEASAAPVIVTPAATPIMNAKGVRDK